MRRLAQKLALSLGVLLVALAGAELCLRACAPVAFLAPPEPASGSTWRELVHRASAVPGLPYELSPGVESAALGVPVRTNALGMRDREVTLEKPASVLRVAAVGDSFTFGFGVPAGRAWPARLEALLNAEPPLAEPPLADRRFEVLNLGVGGYSTRDEAAVVRSIVPRLDADLVVLGYVFNDPEIDPVQTLHAHFAPVAAWRRSHVLRALAHLARRARIARLGDGDYLRFLHASPRHWGSVEAGFDDIAARAAELGIGVIVVVFGRLLEEDWARYPYRDLHAQVRAAAEARGFGVVDMLPVFERHDPPSLCVSPTDGHPNPLAHRLVARAVRDAIAADPERWLR